MPTIEIPDKICPHCGGIRWKHNPKTNQYKCRKKVNEDNIARYHRTKVPKKRVWIHDYYTPEQALKTNRCCKKCSEIKTLNLFPRIKRTETAYSYAFSCTSCHSAAKKARGDSKKSWERIKNDPDLKAAYYLQIKERRQNNPDKFRIIDKKRYEKVKADPVKYQKGLLACKNAKKLYYKDRYKESDYKSGKRVRDKLADSYVVQQITKRTPGLIAKDIPSELVKIKRKQLELYRQLK